MKFKTIVNRTLADHAGWRPDFVLASLLMVAAAAAYMFLPAAQVSAEVSELGVPSESASKVKICKIAGPGIPINTYFRFTIAGTGALSAAPPDQAQYGPVSRTVDVRAGDPAQGGTCEFVTGVGANAPGYDQFQTFVNGTIVTIIENGISPINTVTQNTGQLRTSRIRQSGSSFASTEAAEFSPNPDMSPTAAYVSRAAVVAAGTSVEVEFAGFRFNPTILKICNIAGSSYLSGSDFTFTVSLAGPVSQPDNVPLFPAFSQNVTVAAGPAAHGGFCTFVNGQGLLGGAFNQGSTVTITQAGGHVFSITCPSCGTGGLLTGPPSGIATLSGPNGLVSALNAVIFTNITNGSCGPDPAIDGAVSQFHGAGYSRPECSQSRPVRYDFDGDFKADPAVYNPLTGRWAIATSGSDYTNILLNIFGQTNDKLVPGDYDGDAKVDYAVFRPSAGEWYFLGSTQVYEVHRWGQEGDVSLTGDFDGDRKADFAVWRPSNGTVYIKHSDQTFRIFEFGVASDKPMAEDFDGDGRTDIGMFRDGVWYLLNSTTGFRVYNFGQAGDISVPADYDGDGAADIAVYRAGMWYMLSATAYTVRQHGSAADIPVPADYDADGKTDVAFYNPQRGQWVISKSALAGEILKIRFGTSIDIPLQSPQY